MSYEIYIDIRHHPRHNDEDERKLSTALRLADEGGSLTRAFGSDDDGPIRFAIADALRGYADELAPIDRDALAQAVIDGLEDAGFEGTWEYGGETALGSALETAAIVVKALDDAGYIA